MAKRDNKKLKILNNVEDKMLVFIQDVMFLPVRKFSIPRLLLVIKCMGAGGNIVLAEKWNVF